MVMRSSAWWTRPADSARSVETVDELGSVEAVLSCSWNWLRPSETTRLDTPVGSPTSWKDTAPLNRDPFRNTKG